MSVVPATATPWTESLRRLLPGVWLGMLITIAFVAAPSLFALLDRPSAGRVASRLFTIEAQVSLALCVIVGWFERSRAVVLSRAGRGSRVSTELILVLVALFCTVLGHYALQPAMEAARAGQGRLSFGALHGISTALFGVKTLAVAALAWRAQRGG